MDRFIPARQAAADPMSPASPLAGGSWGRATVSTPRRRMAMRDTFSATAEGASALTWVVGTANDSAGRPGPIVHASVLREELLGRGGGGGGGGSSSSAGDSGGGGGGGGGGDGPGLSMAGLDITSGWDDISLSRAPEVVSQGSYKHPAAPRLVHTALLATTAPAVHRMAQAPAQAKPDQQERTLGRTARPATTAECRSLGQKSDGTQPAPARPLRRLAANRSRCPDC